MKTRYRDDNGIMRTIDFGVSKDKKVADRVCIEDDMITRTAITSLATRNYYDYYFYKDTKDVIDVFDFTEVAKYVLDAIFDNEV